MSNHDTMRQLIGQGCLALDDADFDGFLALCTEDIGYRIEVWSPELRQNMIWLEHDKEGLRALFDALPEHLTRPGRLARHATVMTVNENETGFDCVSTLAVYHTDVDGRSQVLAIGRYRDRIVKRDSTLLLADRTVVLETRDLGVGLHVPL